jgi:hypothetical protein
MPMRAHLYMNVAEISSENRNFIYSLQDKLIKSVGKPWKKLEDYIEKDGRSVN